MKRFCIDTSGLSNPLETMPQDIHSSLWSSIITMIESGIFAVTKEIYDEMTHIQGDVGDCIRSHKDKLLLELGEEGWDWQGYIAHSNRMQMDYEAYISELNGGRKSTIGMNDLSIIAMAKAMGLPLVSMEALILDPGSKSRRIPNICQFEKIEHLTFSEFLRKEKVRL